MAAAGIQGERSMIVRIANTIGSGCSSAETSYGGKSACHSLLVLDEDACPRIPDKGREPQIYLLGYCNDCRAVTRVLSTVVQFCSRPPSAVSRSLMLSPESLT